ASTSTAFMSVTAEAMNRRSTFSKHLPRAVLRSAASTTTRMFIWSAGTTLIAAQGCKVFRWAEGCLEDNIVGAVAGASLEALAADAEGRKTGQRLRTLQERLGTADKSFATLRAAAPGDRLREVIIEAAKGRVPDGTAEEDRNHLKSQAQTWFKSLEGGRELADKMFAFGLWPTFKDRLLPFCNAVLTAVGIDAVVDSYPHPRGVLCVRGAYARPQHPGRYPHHRQPHRPDRRRIPRRPWPPGRHRGMGAGAGRWPQPACV